MKLLLENWKRFLNEMQEVEDTNGLLLRLDPPANIDEIISGGRQKYSNILPEGEQLTKINKFHITLIPRKIHKNLSEEQQQKIKEIIFPEAIIDTSESFFATREQEGRKTLYLKIENSDKLNEEIKKVFPEHQDKYMHMSIANVHGGNSFKSVGDINEKDEQEGGKVIVPATQQQKKKKPQRQKSQAQGADNPVEFAKILVGRGLDPEQIKNILMRKFNKPEHAVVGIMRGAGIQS